MPPIVSVIVPCYNEQATIRLLLESLYNQTYAAQEMEVIIADGRSTDETRARIQEFQADHPDFEITVVENVHRKIPSGLNRALENARGRFIIRLDAHSIPALDYVEQCIRDLQEDKGANVGGVWEIRPRGGGWMSRSIAAAASHPLGVGDAYYRHGQQPGHVDTVPFGAFRRELFNEIGYFDEELETNEDYELNVRIRKSGGRIWLNPEIRSIYFSRSTFAELAQQYWRYGYWKARMLQKHPQTLRWRQLSPLLVISLTGLGILSLWSSWARWLFIVELSVYLLFLIVGGVQVSVKQRDPLLLVGVPIAIATMHLSWGTAFIWSLLRLWVYEHGTREA